MYRENGFSNRAWFSGFFWLIALLFVLRYLWLHQLAGFAFPIPWPDEGSFLWQAIAVQQNNTLFAPQLNPERHVMWMPPGYMIIQGLIFKLTGFSLAWARDLSALYMVVAMLCFVSVLQRFHQALLSVVLCGLFFLNSEFVFTGNFARMESMLLLVVGVSLVLLYHKRIYPALSLVILSPLIHPNGVYFCICFIIYSLVYFKRNHHAIKPSRLEMVPVVTVFFIWCLYLTYVTQHWADFVSDIGFQMSFKTGLNQISNGGFLGRLLLPENIVIVILSVIFLLWKRPLPARFLMVFAAPLFMIKTFSVGFTYVVFTQWLYLVLTIMVVDILSEIVRDLMPDAKRYARYSVTALLVLVAIGIHVSLGNIVYPIGSLQTLTLLKVPNPQGEPYMSDAEEIKVREYLLSVETSERPIKVQMFPSADALLFHDLDGDGIRFIQNTFYDQRKADVYIVHQSKYLPKQLADLTNVLLIYKAGIKQKIEEWDVLIQRDNTEKWLVYPAEKDVGY